MATKFPKFSQDLAQPVALSIVQARLVGLTHFAVGYIATYGAFVIASTASRLG